MDGASRVIQTSKARCSVLQSVTVCSSVFVCLVRFRRVSVVQCVAVCCSVLQCVAACCSVLQCVLQCVVVCCGLWKGCHAPFKQVKCVAVCCSVLQCVAICCSMLQYVAVCCSMLWFVEGVSHAILDK